MSSPSDILHDLETHSKDFEEQIREQNKVADETCVLADNLSQIIADKHKALRTPVKPKEEGTKHDEGKLRLDLILPEFIEGMAGPLTHGCHEHGAYNWQQLDNLKERCTASAMRHFNEWRKGNTYDDGEGGVGTHHLYNMACNLMFLIWNDEQEKKCTKE